MIEWFHPGLIYIVGAFLIPLFRGTLRRVYLLLLPILALINLLLMSKGVFSSEGKAWILPFLGYDLILGRIDKLSMVFAYVFVIASFCMMLYAIHIKEEGQHVAASLYVGSTLGVVFAGDLLTLFFFWEVMAWSALFLIWYRKEKTAYEAGFRYILVHFFGGLCLLGGILLHLHETGSIAFEAFSWGWGVSHGACGFLLNPPRFPHQCRRSSFARVVVRCLPGSNGHGSRFLDRFHHEECDLRIDPRFSGCRSPHLVRSDHGGVWSCLRRP